MRTLSPARQRAGAALILIGDALAIVALFTPWLHLSTSFGMEGDYGPWTLLRTELDAGGNAFVSVLLWLYLPAAVLVVSSLQLLMAKDPRRRAGLARATLLIALTLLVISLLIVTGLPTGLALGWPYYDTLGIEYGALAGLGGLACVALGASVSAAWW